MLMSVSASFLGCETVRSATNLAIESPLPLTAERVSQLWLFPVPDFMSVHRKTQENVPYSFCPHGGTELRGHTERHGQRSGREAVSCGGHGAVRSLFLVLHTVASLSQPHLSTYRTSVMGQWVWDICALRASAGLCK